MDQDEPQKPKPTTEGNPWLKRQPRTGAQQAGKNVGNKNVDASSYSGPVNSNTADEYAPAEIALGNDLVLETLFRYVNRSDLLSCRAVNKQWQSEATKELLRWKLVIRLSFESQENQVSQAKVFQDVCRRLRECRTPSLLTSFQIKIDSGIDPGSAGVGSIFTAVGNQMKHLTLHLNYLMKRSFFERSSFMAHLQNLLFRQAPNLEFLEIEFNFSDHWVDELQALHSADHHLNDNNELLLLPNLETFIVSGSPPPKLFADLINAAGNLRSVGVVWWPFPELYSSPCRGYRMLSPAACGSTWIKYFMGPEGRDKIHLVKRFTLLVNSYYYWSDCDLQLMEIFLWKHKENLKLESFECDSTIFDEDESIDPRVVGVINQILECSAGSLQKLQIQQAKWFEDLLIIPRLPKLQEICFDCDCGWSSVVGLDGVGFFPQGFNMTISLPNVSTIVLLKCDVFLFHLFVSRLEIEMTEPIPSVRRIIVIADGKHGSSVPPLARDFHHIFPHLVSISYVDKKTNVTKYN